MRFQLGAVPLLLLGLCGCSTVSVNTTFDRYCEVAGLDIKARLTGPQRVELDQNHVISTQQQMQFYPFSLFNFVSSRNVQYVDERTKTGTRYLRYAKSLRPIVVRETDTNVQVKIQPLTTEADHEVELYGQLMTISERSTGRVIATYRYFWMSGGDEKYCPKAKSNRLDASAIALYVIGARGNGYDKDEMDMYIPFAH